MLRTMVEDVDAETLTRPLIIATVSAVTAAAATADGTDGGPLHDGVHALRVLSRQLHEAGAGAQTQQGTVAQVSTSSGGVPKTAAPMVDISRRGVISDQQGDRRHHGKPLQAVCLWSADVIDALVAEGHPVLPGASGENITIAGVDWFSLRPGVRLLVGQALLELSAWATPCRKNDQWFTGRSDRIDHDLNPGWSRAYAWVIEPGTVKTGDQVIVEP
jgi:MOSC domain-containing protein YiiM